MKTLLLSTLLAAWGPDVGAPAEFKPPVRLQAAGSPVRVEGPGYAAPCWADIDGDGKKDLLVGQFNGGKIRVFKNLGDGKLAAGKWLQAEGAVAEVPGVW
jgi:FG-GAP-like repeat